MKQPFFMIPILILSILLILIGTTLYCFIRQRHKYTLLLIIIIGAFARIQQISTPQLHNWDEKHHALVAKNLIKTPLKPVLYKSPVLPYKIDDWTANHVWLSKPPLALWMMASSIKLFGTHAIAVRLPSFLLSLIGILLIFYSGKLLFGIKTGLISAFLFAIHGPLIDLANGRISSDHVEHTFIILFLLSIVLTQLLVKMERQKLSMAFLIGTVIGLAFITKWHIAFFTYPIIAGFILVQPKVKPQQKHLLLLIIILSACIIPSIWLAYIYTNYTVETMSIIQGLVSPMTNIIQGHGAPWYYYLYKLSSVYGFFIFIPLLFLTVQLFKKFNPNLFLILLWILIPYIIFSVAETKRFTYILIAAPAMFISIAYYINHILPTQKLSKIIKISLVCLLLMIPTYMGIERLKIFEDNTKTENTFNEWKTDLFVFYASLKKPQKTIIFNDPNCIETMFYTELTSYRDQVNLVQIKQLKKDGYHCYQLVGNKYQAL